MFIHKYVYIYIYIYQGIDLYFSSTKHEMIGTYIQDALYLNF